MHEYAIAEELVRAVLAQLAERGLWGGRVEEVHLRKGELRLLADEALEQAYRILTAGTLLEGSRLILEKVEAEVACGSCGYRGPAEYSDDRAFHFTSPVLECPRCGAAVEVVCGRELELVRLVLAAPEEAGR
ncbi:MAG: hydrogenase maturation nickel metallochaperone HypA [Candidatus Bipolaricaulia bacterium]